MPDDPIAKVSERLRNAHPLVAEALRYFDRRRTDEDGILYRSGLLAKRIGGASSNLLIGGVERGR